MGKKKETRSEDGEVNGESDSKEEGNSEDEREDYNEQDEDEVRKQTCSWGNANEGLKFEGAEQFDKDKGKEENVGDKENGCNNNLDKEKQMDGVFENNESEEENSNDPRMDGKGESNQEYCGTKKDPKSDEKEDTISIGSTPSRPPGFDKIHGSKSAGGEPRREAGMAGRKVRRASFSTSSVAKGGWMSVPGSGGKGGDKKMNDFSLITDMWRFIEIGCTLGHDMQGVKEALGGIIKGIGAKKVNQ